MSWGAGLTLKRRGAHRLVLSPSMIVRVVFAIFLAAILAAPLLEPHHQRPGAAFIIVSAALGIALLYNDSWVFDRQTGVAEGRLGLLVLFRRRRIALSGLAGVRVVTVGRMARLEAFDSTRKSVLLDSSRSTRTEGLRKIGVRIAEFCGLPFTVEPPVAAGPTFEKRPSGDERRGRSDTIRPTSKDSRGSERRRSTGAGSRHPG